MDTQWYKDMASRLVDASFEIKMFRIKNCKDSPPKAMHFNLNKPLYMASVIPTGADLFSEIQESESRKPFLDLFKYATDGLNGIQGECPLKMMFEAYPKIYVDPNNPIAQSVNEKVKNLLKNNFKK